MTELAVLETFFWGYVDFEYICVCLCVPSVEMVATDVYTSILRCIGELKSTTSAWLCLTLQSLRLYYGKLTMCMCIHGYVILVNCFSLCIITCTSRHLGRESSSHQRCMSVLKNTDCVCVYVYMCVSINASMYVYVCMTL